jgi:hypothetical protein
MSRSKRDILDTEAMLTRLTNLLVEHDNREGSDYWIGRARGDAESLRRISMTLRTWFEAECNGDVTVAGDGLAYAQYGRGTSGPFLTVRCANREAGALKRLAKIMARYPSLSYYVQGDPRGCALYILKPDDVPEGADVSSYYSRALAVFK